ncbi:type II secretion system F family protein [Undibacterium sp. RuTC16W]|uniref:type II secretion system F family protein n=1 Tax=Undibacterium sp. RuTC16W TaxID=3413048 RepID=UPI003BF42F2D
MTVYSYRSMSAEGKKVRGVMDVANLPELELRLKRMDLDLIDYKVQVEKTFALGSVKVARKDLINFCFHMEQMTSAGVPILEGLTDLRDSAENVRFRGVVADLIENIEGGSQLSEAMERYPNIFDLTLTSLITAGENTGKISDVFKSLGETLRWQDELSAQTKKIVMYPLFVGTVVLGVTFFLMIYLVPQLTGFIRNMGQELPLHTKVLIFVSGLFIDYWYIALAIPPAIWFGVLLLLKSSPRARYKADGYKLRIWLVGPVLHKIILSRFVTFFALMYESGITILECIRLSENIVNNEVIATGLRRAGALISEGQSVTTAFQSTNIFPPLVIRMLKIGEATGSLDTALRNVSYFYNRDIKEMIEKVQAMIEPVMTVVLGLILGWIMMSVLGPIYDTISKLKT